MVYFQMQSTYLLQSLHLRVPTFSRQQHMVFPAAWLALGNVLLLLLLLPLSERYCFPWLRRRGGLPTAPQRIAMGMASSLMSVSAAGVLEFCRVRFYVDQQQVVQQLIGATTYDAADLTVFTQTPQFALLALAELLASVA
ncbi:solute carrier family 15 member 4-like, partial [Lampetra planeri]